MGGLFKTPKPKVDKSALLAAQEQQRKANEMAQAAQAAEARKMAVEEDGKRKKKNIAASGREATILAGESGERKTLLGS